jgi:hypothetical protein
MFERISCGAMRFMCGERPLMEEVAVTLETREDAARNAAANVEEEALADGLARDRQRLAAVVERLRDAPSSRADELTAGHDDRTDPESDLGL